VSRLNTAFQLINSSARVQRARGHSPSIQDFQRRCTIELDPLSYRRMDLTRSKSNVDIITNHSYYWFEVLWSPSSYQERNWTTKRKRLFREIRIRARNAHCHYQERLDVHMSRRYIIEMPQIVCFCEQLRCFVVVVVKNRAN
jgi:hypothetical protein